MVLYTDLANVAGLNKILLLCLCEEQGTVVSGLLLATVDGGTDLSEQITCALMRFCCIATAVQ